MLPDWKDHVIMPHKNSFIYFLF